MKQGTKLVHKNGGEFIIGGVCGDNYIVNNTKTDTYFDTFTKKQIRKYFKVVKED